MAVPVGRERVLRERRERRQWKREERMRFGTLNVGTMHGKSREFVEMLGKAKVVLCAVQEVRYVGRGSSVYGSGDERYKFWWSGGERGESGVGVFVKEEWGGNVIEVVRWSDRMMKVKMVMGGRKIHFFSVYAPQQGRPAEEKEQFMENLEDRILEVREEEAVMVLGDMNAHVGSENRGYEDVSGKYGWGERNQEGEKVLQMCQRQGMKIWNTMFKKRKEHLVTYVSGNVPRVVETQIDYIMMRGRNVEPFDCRVRNVGACATQHRLVCADTIVKDLKKPSKKRGERRIKVWKLKDPEKKREFQEKLNLRLAEIEGDWKRYRVVAMEVAEEVCQRTTGHKRKERETWWWCEEVRRAIAEKKKAFNQWQRNRTEEKKEIYREKKRIVKREIAVAKEAAWREWCREINTAEGRLKMFKIADQMKKESRDVVGGKYIKDEDENILVDETEINERWRKYFEDLLNEENPCELEDEAKVEGPVEDVTMEEIERALKKMKKGKAPGPSEMTCDILKEVGERGKEELAKVFRNISEKGEIPEEWNDSFTIPIYKGKGDALSCGKYRGVRLLEHGMKLWEKILEGRLRRITKIDECQFGFQQGKSTTDAIFILRQVQEKYKAKRKELYHVFVDLEKAFDRVPRETIRWALRRQKVPERTVDMVMALYGNTKSRVRTYAGISEEFEIRVGVHQGSALSPLLFVLVLEEATKGGRRGLWEMLYADDLVITAESKEAAVRRFNIWKREMEKRGMRVNMEKTKVMVTGRRPTRRREEGRYPCGVCGRNVRENSVLCTECRKWCHKRCSGLRNVNQAGENYKCPTCRREDRGPVEERVEVEGGELEIVDNFCYLGEMMACEGGVREAVRVRIAAAWTKWREISSLLVNKGIPLKNRAVVYCACVRPVFLYGSETWATTKEIERKLRSSDHRMLRCMAGVRLEDRVTTEELRRRCGVEDIIEQLQRHRLRWFGHVRRREEDHVLRRAEEMRVEGRGVAGGVCKTWRRCVREDMDERGLDERDVVRKEEWERLVRRGRPEVRERGNDREERMRRREERR